MPSLSPRSHACDCDLASQPTQENRGYGYLMMNRTIFGYKPNRAAQACPGQATGEVLPRCSFPKIFQGAEVVPNAVIAHWRHTGLLRAILNADRFRPFRSSPEIQPATNTHRPRSGRRFCPIGF